MYRIKLLLKHPLFSGSAIMVGGNMVMNLINYFYHIIMGRVLGPVDYGILASLYSVIYIVGIIPTSSSVAIVKFISSAKDAKETYAVYKSLQRFVMVLAIVFSLGLLFLTPVIASFLKISDIWLVALVPIIFFFLLITLVNQASSQGILKFMGSVGPGLVSSVVKLLLGLLLVIMGWSVFGAMVGVAVGMGLAYVYSYVYIKGKIKKVNSSQVSLKPFLLYAFPVLIQALALTSFFTVDVLLVKHFLSPFDAGIYGALSMLGKIIFFAVSPVIATMFPLITSRIAKGKPYIKILLLGFFLTLAIASPILFVYFFLPELAIKALYGSAYLIASKELSKMGLFMLFYSLSYFLVNFRLSINDVKVVWIPMIAAVLQIILLQFLHSSISIILSVNLSLAGALFLTLLVYQVYISNRNKVYKLSNIK